MKGAGVSAATAVAVALGIVFIGAFLSLSLGFTISTWNRVQKSDVINSGTRVFLDGASCPAGEDRRRDAYTKHEAIAYTEYARGVPCHTNNGDEATYTATRAGSYSKGLPHNSLGIVDANAYATLLGAVESGIPAHFDAIPLGSGPSGRKLVNPQSGIAFNLIGGDPASFGTDPAPAISSSVFAHELAENYWMALARDVSFDQYGLNNVTLAAAAELSQTGWNDYGGPYPAIAATNLFRGNAPGCNVGPYISQFLYLPCWFGANQISQKLAPPTPGVNFMTQWPEFLAIQNGQQPNATLTYDPSPRYIINGRDLSHWVHVDVLFQAYMHAALILMTTNAPLKPTVPYVTTEQNQMAFGTFGGPEIAGMLGEIAPIALKAAWYQKWFVHRKLRPEAAAGRVDRTLGLHTTFPLHADILASSAVAATKNLTGTWLLPQAFPEGSPLHPSYAAGHATVAGACITLLKFYFREDYVLPSPVQPDSTGHNLLPYTGPALTVGGELNKLAANVGIGRNIAGVHWRSDANESFKLGEQVAIAYLRTKKPTYNENVPAWTATGFDGTLLVV